jgi:membrane-bound ClpP family serine protease
LQPAVSRIFHPQIIPSSETPVLPTFGRIQFGDPADANLRHVQGGASASASHWNGRPVIPLAASIRCSNIAAMELVITLLVVGAILLVLETVLPGMIAGILGLFCLIAGIVQSFITFGPRTGSYVLAGVVLGLMIGTALWIKFFPQTPMARLFTSQRTVGEIGTERPELLHQKGHALTPLRPSGTAVIDGRRIDVVTEGGLIARDTPVVVVAVEGMRVVVRAVTETSTPKPT